MIVKEPRAAHALKFKEDYDDPATSEQGQATDL